MVLQLPKLLDDGCVLQAGATIHIWGAGDPGRGVLIRLDGKDRTTRVKDDGSWSVPYGPIKAGGPYDLTVRYENRMHLAPMLCGRSVPVFGTVEHGTAHGLGACGLSAGVGS